MERRVYEKYLTNKNSLSCNEDKWKIRLSSTDKLIGAKILDISFRKDEDDLNDDCEVQSSCSLYVELDNGSTIDIYFDIEGDINIESD